jgi:hypothetical protein
MSSPERRPVGEVLADVERADPGLADELKAALAQRRLADDLADAETILRSYARTGSDQVARALQVLLAEYDARAGRTLEAPQVGRRTRRPEPVRPERLRDAGGDVIAR